MASYKQLSKYNWRAQISLGYINGKKKLVKKQGFKNKKEAEKWVTETLNKYDKGYIIPSTNSILFEEFLMKWFDEFKSNTLSINTYTNYTSRINTHILPSLGSYKLTEINNVIVQDFYNKLIKEGLKPSSAKKVLEILNGCFKYAKKLKLIYNIPTDIEKVKSARPLVESWNQDELNYFLNEIENEYLYFPVLLDSITGLRVGELCGLKWRDIELDKGYININGQVIHDKTTNNLTYTPILKTDTSNRSISIPEFLVNYLEYMYKRYHQKKSDFVIKDRDGSMCHPRNISMDFSRRISKYKYSADEMNELYPDKDLSNYKQLRQITFHGLRHTHATLLILNGENIKVVSSRLGHKDIATTLQTYTHVIKDMEQNTATLLQKMFNDLIPVK